MIWMLLLILNLLLIQIILLISGVYTFLLLIFSSIYIWWVFYFTGVSLYFQKFFFCPAITCFNGFNAFSYYNPFAGYYYVTLSVTSSISVSGLSSYVDSNTDLIVFLLSLLSLLRDFIAAVAFVTLFSVGWFLVSLFLFSLLLVWYCMHDLSRVVISLILMHYLI